MCLRFPAKGSVHRHLLSPSTTRDRSQNKTMQPSAEEAARPSYSCKGSHQFLWAWGLPLVP